MGVVYNRIKGSDNQIIKMTYVQQLKDWADWICKLPVGKQAQLDYFEAGKPTPMNEDTILGLRKPGTEEGTWTGAWVAGKDENGKVVAAVFEDNMDYIANDLAWKLVISQKNKFEEDGWQPMTREDIRKTAGI